MEEAIKRGNAFAKAGADLIFVEAPEKVDDIKRVIQSIEAPVSINMIYAKGSKTPAVSIKQLEEWGAARVSVPVMPLFAASRALEKAYTAIVNDDVVSMNDQIFEFSEFTDLVGLPFIKELEKKYLDTVELDARYNR